MRIFHEQTFGPKAGDVGAVRPKGNSMTGQQISLPTLVDTRPWIFRKAVGEIPNSEGVSFLDLLEKDKASGA